MAQPTRQCGENGREQEKQAQHRPARERPIQSAGGIRSQFAHGQRVELLVGEWLQHGWAFHRARSPRRPGRESACSQMDPEQIADACYREGCCDHRRRGRNPPLPPAGSRNSWERLARQGICVSRSAMDPGAAPPRPRFGTMIGVTVAPHRLHGAGAPLLYRERRCPSWSFHTHREHHMPKLKTHSGAAKRFTKTASGQVQVSGQSKMRHILITLEGHQEPSAISARRS